MVLVMSQVLRSDSRLCEMLCSGVAWCAGSNQQLCLGTGSGNGRVRSGGVGCGSALPPTCCVIGGPRRPEATLATSNIFWQFVGIRESNRQIAMSRTGPEVVRIKRKRDDDVVDYLRLSHYTIVEKGLLTTQCRL